MADETAKALFKQAVEAARKKDLPAARKLIQAAIRLDPQNEMAWLVFASIADNKRNQLICLKTVLEINPNNAQALKMVRDLGVDPQQLMQVKSKTGNLKPRQTNPFDVNAAPQPSIPVDKPASEPSKPSSSPFGDVDIDPSEIDEADLFGERKATPAPASADIIDEPLTDEDDADPLDTLEAELAADPPPPPPKKEVPIPKPEPRPQSYDERLFISAQEAEEIAALWARQPAPPEGAVWVKKEKNRAGENEIRVVRAAAATGIFVAVVLPLMIVSTILWNTPLVQNIINPPTRVASGLVEPTSTATPLTTPTNTPGFTPTPSQTPTAVPEDIAARTPTLTPTPTIIFRRGILDDIEPTPFALVGQADNAERNGAQFIAEGNYAVALPTLSAARQGLGSGFSGNVYYLEALALAYTGETETALELLTAADQLRIQRAPNNTDYEAAIKAGIAAVHLEIARADVAAGNPAAANDNYTIIDREAERAIFVSPQWGQPYVTLTDRYRLAGNNQQALATIERALAQPTLSEDTRFIVARGEIYLEEGRLSEADHQAYLALWIDPTTERAHDLRARIALAQNDTAAASIYAQTYNYYHPQTLRGWELLAEVRFAENNPLLAIEALTQAIVIGENTTQPPAVDAYLTRAEFYAARGQYQLAALDVAKAAEATQNPELLRREMQLASLAGNHTRAGALATELSAQGAITDGERNLIQARAITAQPDILGPDYERIAELIDTGINTIPAEQQPEANTLRALAYLQLAQFQTALGHVNTAISNGGESVQRRFIRAQALEGNAQYTAALLEFERVLAFGQLAPLDDATRTQAQEAIRRIENTLAQQVAAATATAQAR